MTKNIRRIGVPATKRGVPNPDYRQHLPKLPIDLGGLTDEERAKLERVAISKVPPVQILREPETYDGPTNARQHKSEGHFTIGDDKQGTRIYHFHDSPLDRLYSRLARGRGVETARQEYVALQKYRHHWHHGGLEASIGSVDLNRIFAADPSSMSGMPKTERQAHHRRQYREARELLGWKPHIVVENIVCAETSIEIAGWAIGGNSRTHARDTAERILRESARMLAKHWGI